MEGGLIIQPAPPPHVARAQAVARGVLAGALVLLGLWTLRSFVPALVWAAVFAIAIWPVYHRVAAQCGARRHNVVVPLGFTLLVALVFIAPLALLAMQVGREAHNLMHWLQDVREHGMPVPDVLAHLPLVGGQVEQWWQTNLSDPSGYRDLLDRLNRAEIYTYGRDVGAQVAHRAVLFAFTIVTLFFLFKDGLFIADQMLRASRKACGAHGERIALLMVASIHGTVDGLVLVGIGEGILMGVAYAIAGVPHAILLGAFTGVAAIIPFGAPVAFAIASLLLLAQGATVAAIVIFAIGMAVATIADHFVRPGLIGGATKLPFLWVLLGILGGVETWGLLGLFIGPAVMSALILLWREFADRGAEVLPVDCPDQV